MVADALVEEVNVPAMVRKRTQNGELRCLCSAHRSEVIGKREETSGGGAHRRVQFDPVPSMVVAL
jgi:hypothetical protein